MHMEQEIVLPTNEIEVVSEGNVRPAWAVQAVDHFMRNIRNRPLWESIEFWVKVWKELPGADEHLRYVAEQRKLSINKHGATKDLSVRRVAIIPENLMSILEKLYSDEIDANPKAFMRKFAHNFPEFSPVEEI